MMPINQKTIRILNKIFEAGFVTEKDIVAMTMDDILQLTGVTMADLSIINGLQKSIKTGKLITFLSDGEVN